MTNLNDTIVALATPAGKSAIAVIRVSGSAAIEWCAAVFKGKNLRKQATHTAHFGRILDLDGTVIDEVIATIFRAPHTYSGDDTIEISSHGSPFIVQRLIALMINKGARLAKPGEFTMRAFLNGKMDLSQAEAVADLIAAENEAAHTLAMRQMRGGYSQQIAQLRQQLIHFASLIELELDFAEEDVEFAERSQLVQLIMQLQILIAQLIQSFFYGNALKQGIGTVIAGRPNAGKSTLLNALLNEERALVSDIAGTTRDTIEEVWHINGIAFRLMDTAGIRQNSTDTIENMGIQRSLDKIKNAYILLYVVDLSQPDWLKNVTDDLPAFRREGLHIVVLGNKSDIYTHKCDIFPQEPNLLATELPSVNHQNIPDNFIYISAKNKDGLSDLRETLYQIATKGKNSLGNDQLIVTNARHYEAFVGAEKALKKVLQGIAVGLSGELLSIDIKQALQHLSEITGNDITNDTLLDNIFANFCIGK